MGWTLPNLTNFIIAVTALLGTLLSLYHAIAARVEGKANKTAIETNHAASTAAIAAVDDKVKLQSAWPASTQGMAPQVSAGPTLNVNVTAPAIEVETTKPAMAGLTGAAT